MSSPSLGWFAGFFDGEGYIGVGHQTAYDAYLMRATVTNNVRATLEPYRRRFGGNIKAPHYGKSAWSWSVHGEELIVFLKAIRPHLIAKAAQVDLALRFPRGRPGRPVTPEEQRLRASIYHQLMGEKIPTDELPLIERKLEELAKRPQVRRALKLYNGGMTMTAIGEKLGVPQGTVSYWIRHLADIVRSRSESQRIGWKSSTRNVINRADADQAEELYKDGIPIAEIARRLKKKPATVNYWLRRRGVTRSLKEAQQLRRKREKR